jgi:Asp-tRNA(Asn)/Glu-tRNA(Gln) amidotransferase A subunit family amidase
MDAAQPSGGAQAARPAPDLPFATLREAAEALAQGRISALELTELCLARIAQLNPTIGAITGELPAAARRKAQAIDDSRRRGAQLGPLAGIPVAVKDLIDTRTAICSAGLPFLADYRPTGDAAVVRRLRRAGAVILGVTATDPGAFGVRTAAVRHPQHPALTVGGSSGGSGAAVAAGLCYAALGSDTGGSIRIPAACCAVAGLKPTRGRLPLAGVRPLVASLDHVGPLARRVADLVIVEAALDPAAFRRRGKAGRARSVVGHDPSFHQDADAAVNHATAATLDACRALGAEIREVRLPAPDEVLRLHGVIFAAESTAYHMGAFAEHRSLYSDVARAMFELAERHRGYDYVRAMDERAAMTARVLSLHEDVDFILLPTLPVLTPERAAETIRIGGSDVEFTLALIRYTCLFNHTGQPVVAMPSALARGGVAASVQLVGNRGDDAATLDFAAALERELGLDIDFRPVDIGTLNGAASVR